MELLDAVQAGNLEYVKNCIDNDAWFKRTPWSDYILLTHSVRRNRLEVAKYLLERNCRVNRTDGGHFGHTPLHIAIEKKNLELIKMLLSRGAWLNAKNAKGDTPVHLAGKMKVDDILDAIMPYMKVDKNTNYTNKYGITHFHIACMSSNVTVVKNFVKKGISVRRPVKDYSPTWPSFTPLHFAVSNNRITIAEVLLKYGANPNDTDIKGVSPLHLAFRNKHYLLVELLLNKADAGIVNLVDDLNTSYFHITCSQNNSDLLDKFLDHDFDINACISSTATYLAGYTPLHIAVFFAQYDMVKWLLKHRADFTKHNSDGLTPVHLAFWKKEYGIIDLFLQAIKEYSAYDNHVDKYGVSFFHISCLRENPLIVEEFIKRGAKVNKPIKETSQRLATCTPLHIAVRYENPGNVDVLLRYKANMHAADIKGETPLHYLCQGNQDKMDALMHIIEEIFTGDYNEIILHLHLGKAIDILGCFIAAKVDVNIKDKAGLTPLFHLFNYRYDVALASRLYEIIPSCPDRKYILSLITQSRNTIIKIMALSNPIFTLKDKRGNTLLHHLAARIRPQFVEGQKEIAKLMIKGGADVNAANNKCETPLYVAVKNGHEDLVNVLLIHGAEVNIFVPTQVLNTPLTVAVDYLIRHRYGCKPRIVKKLIEYGADVNTVIADGRTALHFVFCSGRTIEMPDVLMICNRECNLNVQEPNAGKTALHIATEVGDAFGVDFLLHSGARYDIKDHQGYDPIHYCTLNPKPTGHIYYNYFQKMRVIGFRYSSTLKANLDKIKLGCEPSFIFADEVYFKELKRLKNIRINMYATLYNFLFLSIQDMARYVRDPKVHRMITCPTFSFDFPFYGEVIANRFRTCIVRYKILNTSMTSFGILTENLLPDHISEKILGYLSNDEIENVIKSSKIKPIGCYNYNTAIDEPMDLSTRYR